MRRHRRYVIAALIGLGGCGINGPSPPLAQGTAIQEAGMPVMALNTSLEQPEPWIPVATLQDVSPTHWAWSALRSLAEEYACLNQYPPEFWVRDRPLSRHEFAVGLQACQKSIALRQEKDTQILASDLATLQALLSAFALEIVLIKGRTDGLESRIIDLETIQFSTTSKLSGQGLFGSNDVWGGGNENQTVFQNRVNLALITSFSGLDKLRLDLTAGNTSKVETLNTGDRAFDLAGNTAEGTLASQVAANTDSAVLVTELSYQLPLNKHLAIAVLGAQSRFQSHLPTLNPGFADLDQGAISSFAQGNPLYWLGGGGSGIITHWRPVNALQFSGGYLAQTADDPTAGQGFFNGSYSALAQLTWEISDRVSVAGLYLNNYASTGEFGFRYNDLAVTGTGIANSLAGQINNSRDSPVLTNAYGAQFSWQPSEPISVNGWLSTFYSRLLGRGDGQLWTYAITVGWQDLGGEGNFGGIVIGAEPYLTKFHGGSPDDFAIDVPLHAETFYRRQISDNLSLTGGLIWLLAPNQDRNNSDAVIGTIRTNFIF